MGQGLPDRTELFLFKDVDLLTICIWRDAFIVFQMLYTESSYNVRINEIFVRLLHEWTVTIINVVIHISNVITFKRYSSIINQFHPTKGRSLSPCLSIVWVQCAPSAIVRNNLWYFWSMIFYSNLFRSYVGAGIGNIWELLYNVKQHRWAEQLFVFISWKR